MAKFNEGDTSKGICEKCKKKVTTTFRYKSFRIPDTKIVVLNVLQGFCDICGTSISIPHQETPKIRKQLDKKCP